MITLPPSRYILPNLFTLAAAFCGFAVIVLASRADDARGFFLAASLIPIACILDGFDGRIARLVNGESAFGVQFDSLSDFLTFGVAPATLIYFWTLEPLGLGGLFVAFLFAGAAMTRLARFNVEASDESASSRHFKGLPAPMAGMALTSLVALEAGVLGRVGPVDIARPSVLIFVLLIAFLMVSHVPFRTLKDTRMTPLNRLLIAGVLASIVVVGIRFDFMFALALGLLGYITSGLLAAVVNGHRRGRERRRGQNLFDAPLDALEELDELSELDDDMLDLVTQQDREDG